MKRFNKFLKAQKAVTRLLGKENVLTDEVSLSLNSFDGSPVKTMPDAVLNIKSQDVLPELIKILNKFKVPFVPRTAATNHDGGTIALKGGCVLNLSALDKILLIDTNKHFAVVQCGVINKTLQDALAPLGFFYAPDPASMAFSTIGGNTSLNAGGAKTLKYGASAANILKAEIITPRGDLLVLDRNTPGPDLMSLLVRSEGTLSIITKLWVKITPSPACLKTALAYFKTLEDTMQTVKEIIALGILPAALEAMDKTTMDATKTPYPQGLEAVLIIELDSEKQKQEEELKQVLSIFQKNNAIKIEYAQTEEDRQKLWAKRKSAAASLVKLAPNLMSLDCALPREKLPAVIEEIREIFKKYSIRAGMVFHAGDGNVHPNIVFDEKNLFETAQIKKAVKEINTATIKAGGSISGEHGVGVEKRAAMAMMYDNNALNLFKKIKNALDPLALANPDKVIPVASVNEQKDKAPVPADIQPLIQKIKNALHKGEGITVSGLNTKLKTKNQNILQLSSLNKITDIDKTNYTVSVQAGVSVEKLAKELAAHNMFLPFDNAKGSIGGVFAAKTFPFLEDYVTGIDFILADGSFLSIGGKHVKNAAGYDLIRFLAGSQGAFAVITALTVRTFAAPVESPCRQNNFILLEPSKYTSRLKEVFDPKNILNLFIFKAGKNEK